MLLTAETVEAQSGLMGTVTLLPGEVLISHCHPHSDEYIYVAQGQARITDECSTTIVLAGTGIFIPKNVPHSIQNSGITLTTIVFFSTPLAPHPELEHVMLEEYDYVDLPR
jgi:putative monooxygenase